LKEFGVNCTIKSKWCFEKLWE